MNGLRTRMRLDAEQQRVHNDLANSGDRAVFVGSVIIAVILAALMAGGAI